MSAKLMLAISVALLAGIVWYANPAELAAELAKADVTYLVLALLVSSASMVLRILKWFVLLEHVSFRVLAPVQLSGMMISNFSPAKVAEPLKAFVLKALTGRPVAETLPTIVWERVFDLVMLVILSVLGVSLFAQGSRMVYVSYLAIAIFVCIIVVFVAVVRSEKFGTLLFRAVRKLPVVKKLPEEFMAAFYRAKVSRLRLLVSCVVTSVPWITEGVLLHLALRALGVASDPLMLASAIALAELIAIASSLPGGLGTFEGMLLLFLQTLGIAAPVALAGIIAYRFLTFWYGVALGAVALAYVGGRTDISRLIKEAARVR